MNGGVGKNETDHVRVQARPFQPRGGREEIPVAPPPPPDDKGAADMDKRWQEFQEEEAWK